MAKIDPYWGNNLKFFMDLHDMSAHELAELAGVTDAAVYQWMSKKYPTLTASKAAQLADIFHVPFYKIFPLVVPQEDDAEPVNA